MLIFESFWPLARGGIAVCIFLCQRSPGENQRDRAQNIAAINDNNGRTVPKGLNRMAEWTMQQTTRFFFSLFVPVNVLAVVNAELGLKFNGFK